MFKLESLKQHFISLICKQQLIKIKLLERSNFEDMMARKCELKFAELTVDRYPPT